MRGMQGYAAVSKIRSCFQDVLTALRLSNWGNIMMPYAHLIAFHAWDNLFVFWDL